VIKPLQHRLQALRDHIDCYCVYIREAHPVEGGVIPENNRLTPIHAAKSLDQRRANARTCMAQLDITVPVLVDGLENETADAYRAWPQRVYVIDRDGTIVYKDVAPGNTDLSALESALRDLSDAER
jgi:hypothetical protein